MRAVGSAHLAEPRARRLHEVGQPEAVTDLDQLAAADHDLLTGCQRHRGEQERGCVVVDDVHAARRRDRAGQSRQRTAAAAGAAAGFQVEFDVGGAAGRHHRVDRALRQGRPTQIRVHHDAGGVDDRPKARRGARQCGDGVVGHLLRLDLTGPGPLLRLRHNGFHQCAAEHPFGLSEPRVSEENIGARHAPPRISHSRLPGDFGVNHGGGGRESNPPATGSAAQRF